MSVAYIFSNKLVAQSDKLYCNKNRVTLPLIKSLLTHSLVFAYELDKLMDIIEPTLATKKHLQEFHDSDYIDYLLGSRQEFEQENEFGLIDDCHDFPGLGDYVRSIAGSSLTAADMLLKGYQTVINWDGGRHHAKKDMASGFCYVNDIVLAIERLQSKFSRILYVDLDVHHGDGVESAFLYTKRVVTLSLHKKETGFFPGTGQIDDIGRGKGLYHTINVPLAHGISGEVYNGLFHQLMDHLMHVYNPECIVLQCGADSLPKDPLGGFNVDMYHYGKCVEKVLSFGIPTMLLGGGGYTPQKASRLWTFLTGIACKVSLPNDIPEHDLWTEYRPDYELFLEPCNIKDENRNVQELLEKVLSNIQQIKV
jgi:acetoin utilization deacetylase AcuC-like enzyme